MAGRALLAGYHRPVFALLPMVNKFDRNLFNEKCKKLTDKKYEMISTDFVWKRSHVCIQLFTCSSITIKQIVSITNGWFGARLWSVVSPPSHPHVRNNCYEMDGEWQSVYPASSQLIYHSLALNHQSVSNLTHTSARLWYLQCINNGDTCPALYHR